MKQNLNKYPDDFKLKVSMEYIESDKSQVEILRKYNIKGSSCITNWVRKFDLIKPTRRDLEVRLQMSKNIKKTKLEIQQGSEIKRLKELLELEQLKTEALDTLIDIAEGKLKIDIRKKSGPKQ